MGPTLSPARLPKRSRFATATTAALPTRQGARGLRPTGPSPRPGSSAPRREPTSGSGPVRILRRPALVPRTARRGLLRRLAPLEASTRETSLVNNEAPAGRIPRRDNETEGLDDVSSDPPGVERRAEVMAQGSSRGPDDTPAPGPPGGR